MVSTRRGLAPAGLAAGAFLVWATLTIGARADDKPIAMKIFATMRIQISRGSAADLRLETRKRARRVARVTR